MSQPRYAEFYRLKAIVDAHAAAYLVDGNDDTDNEFYDGGTTNG